MNKLFQQLCINVVLLFITQTVMAQMSGTYTVGSGGEYTTISEAIADINSSGLSGDVTLQIGVGFYAERIDLSNLNNGAFRVTLEGEVKQSTILSPPNQDAAAIKAGIVMQTTSNVTLRNLTYNMSEITDNTSGSSQNIYGIYLEDASNITLDESIVINSTVVIDDEYEISSSFYMYNTNNVSISANQFEGALQHIEFDYFNDLTISGNTFENAVTHIRYFLSELGGGNAAPGNNLMVENNIFTGGFNGIQTSAGSLSIDPLPSNLIIENNEFNDQESYAIRIGGYEAIDIVGNTITADASGMRAMQITAVSGTRISNNVIDTSEGSGIYLTSSDDVQLYNNIASSKVFSLELFDMTSSEVIHNTFHINGNNALRSTVAWIYGGSENLTLINNIFSGPAPEMGADENIVIEFLGEHVNLEQDHNLFDADLGVVVWGASNQTFINGTSIFHEDYDLSELSAWSDHVDLDINSQSFSPMFLDDTDFRIGNGDFRFGSFLSEYNTDIDGETRVEGSVDVGADQFCVSFEVSESIESCESYGFDGLTLTESGEYFGEFVATNGCDSLVTLNLTILEATAGSDAITAEGSYDWNGTIYSESGTYEQTLINQAGCDSVATLSLTIEPYFLEGNFIIGSSAEADFSDFTEASNDLQYATLTGNVTYFIEPGLYNEVLNLSNINTGEFSVVFEGGDNTTRTLHPPDQIEASGSGILIDGISNVTIQNLTLEMGDISDDPVQLSSNDTKGIAIVGSDNITLDNLVLRNGSEVIDYSANQFLISSGLSIANMNTLTVSNSDFGGAGSHITIGEHSNVSILENTFQSASEMIRNDPTASDPTGSNLLIEGNDLSGPFDLALDLSLVEDLVIRSNDLDGIDGNESRFGILSRESIGLIIQDNTIKNVEFGITLDTDIEARVVQNRVTTTLSEAFYADQTEDLTVVNNFFGDIVYVERQTNLDFIHNTVVSRKDRDGVIFFEEDEDAVGEVAHRIVNNIFVGGNEIATLVSIFGENTNLDLTLDHNLYFLEENEDAMVATSLVDYFDQLFVTLDNWQNQGTYDQNSQSFSPAFVDTDDFHITNGTDYRFGTFIADYATDIDGETRIEGLVDVGADQYCVTFEVSESIEACESFEFDGLTLTESGEYFGELVATNGCDSLVTLNLTIIEKPTAEIEVNGATLLANLIDGATYQWFDCDTNEPIIGADEQQWTPPQTGEYLVEVTSGGCSAQSDCISFAVVTSVDDQLDRQIPVYPNPSFGQVNIDLANSLTRLASVEVADLTGKVYQVRSERRQERITIELPETAGVYLITIRSEGELPYITRVIRE